MAISIGDAVLKVGVDTKDVDKGMKGLKNKLKQHQKAIGIAMVAAGGAILAAGVMSVKAYAQMGDEVAKMARRTGWSTEALSELRHAAEISGSSLGSLEKGVRRMSMAIADAKDGLATYTREFDKIGVSLESLEGLKPEEQFFKIASAIAAIEDPTIRSAAAQKLFGRAGTELLPLLSLSAEEMARLREETHELGLVFDKEASLAAEEMTDAMTRMKDSISGLKIAIAKNLLPPMMKVVNGITDIVKKYAEWTRANPELARTTTLVGTAVAALVLSFGAMLLILPKLQAALAAFNITLHLSLPIIGWIALAITGLILLLGPLKTKLKNAIDAKEIEKRTGRIVGSLQELREEVEKDKTAFEDLAQAQIDAFTIGIDEKKKLVDEALADDLEAGEKQLKRIQDEKTAEGLAADFANVKRLEDLIATEKDAETKKALEEELRKFKRDHYEASLEQYQASLIENADDEKGLLDQQLINYQLMWDERIRIQKKGFADMLENAEQYVEDIHSLTMAEKISPMTGLKHWWDQFTGRELERQPQLYNIPYADLPGSFDKGGTIREPTMLYGLKTKQPYAVAHTGETVSPTGAGVTNNFNISELVVREDADVHRIARDLYRLQTQERRVYGGL